MPACRSTPRDAGRAGQDSRACPVHSVIRCNSCLPLCTPAPPVTEALHRDSPFGHSRLRMQWPRKPERARNKTPAPKGRRPVHTVEIRLGELPMSRLRYG